MKTNKIWIIAKKIFSRDRGFKNYDDYKKSVLFGAPALLLALSIFLLTGCGDSSSKNELPKSLNPGDSSSNIDNPKVLSPGNSSIKSDKFKALTPHAAIQLNAGIEIESYLAITSNNNTESAISVTRGGNLTLNNSSIVKTASASSTSTSQVKNLASGPFQAFNSNESPGALAGVSSDPNQVSRPNQEPDPNQAPDVNQAPGALTGVSTDPKKAFHPKQSFDQDQSFDPNKAPDPNQAPGALAGASTDPDLEPNAPELPKDDLSNDEADGSNGGGDIGSRSSGVHAGRKGSATLSNVSIDTNLAEGKGLSAIGKGSSIIMVKGIITTNGGSSHGVFVSGGGAVSLKDVSITTKGVHSSTLATDTGGGTIVVEGGIYTASGKYSAGIYSTGDIRASNAIFKSEIDSATVMEYGSKITLDNTSLWSGKKAAVMIFQSMDSSGDISKYKMTGGEITSVEGPIFYITNTTATIDLKGVKLSGVSRELLKAIKGDWGSDVAAAKPIRGGTVTFTADEQTLPGDIVMDGDSSIMAILKNKSMLKGAINANNKGKKMNLTLDSSSTWDVTADSYLNALNLSDVSSEYISNITGNGHTVYYDKALSAALGGKTYNLAKGGKLQPK